VLEAVDRRVPSRDIEERAHRRQVAAIRIDGPRRPPSLEPEEEAFDVGVGSTHSARWDSPGARRLLSGAILRRLPVRIAAVVGTSWLAVLAFGTVPSATAGSASVLGYPSSQSIDAAGPLPRGGTGQLVYNAAIGERESAVLVVKGAKSIGVSVTTPPEGLGIRLFFGHYVSAGGKSVADALEPWGGGERQVEGQNQPIYVQVEVPYGTPAGRYAGAISVTADGQRATIPLRIRVFPVTLPRPDTRTGNLLTSFNVSPESYVAKVAQLHGFASNDQRRAANRALYALLGSYRISPASWGFGEPRGPSGYESSAKWWLDSAGNFLGQLRSSPGFSALRIPISSNRTAEHNYIAKLSPFAPETWCEYLGRVRAFWTQHEALGPDRLAYVFGYDEPSVGGQRLVARQASTVHRCFSGGRQMMTGSPSRTNTFLWDGKGGDDLDIWTVLSRRYYGTWTGPVDRRAGKSRSRTHLRIIDKVRARGKMVWSYTYTGTPGTPGVAATEPLSNPRMLMLWTALEGVEGVFYAQGITSYTKDNPLQAIGTGEAVLIYPGPTGPWPSARLEQLRDGIEDWAILDQVRKRRGADDVRAILGKAGLFSASRGGVRLACHLGCELKSSTKFSWPLWSRDASTPRRIEAARLAALDLAR
jgi:Glycoside hydrolase 123, catalytic domain